MFLSQINLDEHASTNVNTYRIYKGGMGASPPEAEEIFKKNQTKWRLFLIFFFCAFWQGSLNPQNYELAP